MINLARVKLDDSYIHPSIVHYLQAEGFKQRDDDCMVQSWELTISNKKETYHIMVDKWAVRASIIRNDVHWEDSSETFYYDREIMGERSPFTGEHTDTDFHRAYKEALDWGLGNMGKCVCNRDVNYQFSYCPSCGQKLDWGKDK